MDFKGKLDKKPKEWNSIYLMDTISRSNIITRNTYSSDTRAHNFIERNIVSSKITDWPQDSCSEWLLPDTTNNYSQIN